MIKLKEKIIIKKHRFLSKDSLNQGLGLMFFNKNKFDFGLIFDRGKESIIGSSIHMFFVFFKIKVIYLNSKKEVVDIILKAKPFFIYYPKKKARYIIELPIETDISFIKINDKLSW